MVVSRPSLKLVLGEQSFCRVLRHAMTKLGGRYRVNHVIVWMLDRLDAGTSFNHLERALNLVDKT